MNEIAQLKELIHSGGSNVFFGGAGVSVPSGIPDFRSQDGLYNIKYKYPPETIISHSFFQKMPSEFYRFYKEKMVYPEAEPNDAHLCLAQLESEGMLDAVITQNIDGLHTYAGSKNVIEIHGSIHRNHCVRCGKAYGLDYITSSENVPYCECGGIVKPDVVLYEESLDPDDIQKAVYYISKCDLLIIGGTSLSVYPAAGFINYLKSGAKIAIINMSPTPADTTADILINQSIDTVFRQLV